MATTKCSEHKNPLIRNGTSQDKRLLPALKPDSVQVVDKSVPDWMVWASAVSEHFKYYGNNNVAAGTMQPFFIKDIAVLLAHLAVYDPAQLRQYFKEQLILLEKHDDEADEAIVLKTYTAIWDVLWSVLVFVEEIYTRSAETPDFRLLVQNLIHGKLIPLSHRMLGYFVASRDSALLDHSTIPNLSVFHMRVRSSGNIEAWSFSKSWRRTPDTDWSETVANTIADNTIFGSGTTKVSRIQHARRHNFFTGILDEATGIVARITTQSKASLEKLLAEWPKHEPHYTLFLAWLHLMESTRTATNQLTARHLDFYYRDVLRLKLRPAHADQAITVLELTKAVSHYALPAQTVFLGGKNKDGSAIKLRNSRETVLGKARVAFLKSVYLGDEDDSITGVNNNGRLFAAPVANSADGLGKKLTTPLKDWHPFVQRTYNGGVLQSIDAPPAIIGWAVASHYLRLAEGARKVVISFEGSNLNRLHGKSFKAYLTSEKGWLDLGHQQVSNNTPTLQIEIDAKHPAVTGYVKKIHGHFFETNEPVLKLELPHDNTIEYTYSNLAKVNVTSVSIKVQVGGVNGSFDNNGIRNLRLQNVNGPVDGSKPFLPWGPEPKPGSSFFIGSAEIFAKPSVSIQLNLEWKGVQSTLFEVFDILLENAQVRRIPRPLAQQDKVALQQLISGKWQGLTASETVTTTVYSSALNDGFLAVDEDHVDYSTAAKKGWLRLLLKHDLEFEKYHKDLVNHLIDKANEIDISAPVKPYEPVLHSCTLSYSASCSSSLNTIDEFADRPLKFIHVGPFGDAEQHLALQGKEVTLLQDIARSENPITAQGELYIGLADIAPGASTSIWVQVVEGSEDPLIEKPKDHITWHYLKANAVWAEMEDVRLSDSTDGLIRSGLLLIQVPEDAGLHHTLLPTNCIWIKAKVKKAPGAVCRIIDLHPNAVLVTRDMDSVKEQLLLTSGTISKLETPLAQIKKITQPYSSFGGRPAEHDDAFYLRVSERLRHRDRAITIWDYERLVLDAFPDIYRVKCLNHTKVTGNASDGSLEYNEVAPGHVTVVTIPRLHQRNESNPLKPYTRKSVQEAIRTFLKQRVSCQVTLHVAQPLFEEVRLSAVVFLASGYTDVPFYTNQLQQDLTAFLCPWAFGNSSSLDFGGRLYKSVLIDFIEELHYVDHLTDVHLFHKPGDTAPESGDREEITASTARSVLVSAPASRHQFEVKVLSAPQVSTQCPEFEIHVDSR